jgi:hypothetical protein
VQYRHYRHGGKFQITQIKVNWSFFVHYEFLPSIRIHYKMMHK